MYLLIGSSRLGCNKVRPASGKERQSDGFFLLAKGSVAETQLNRLITRVPSDSDLVLSSSIAYGRSWW